MRLVLRLLLTSSGLALLAGCQSRSLTAVPDPDSNGQASLGALYQQDQQSLAALGLWELTLDPESLHWESRLLEARSGQGSNNNDLLYLLDIAKFVKADDFRIRGIVKTADEIQVRYEVSHPFSGPADPLQPPSASNRTDLGITGMVLFLVDAPVGAGTLFFDEGAGNRVIANTTLVANPDAYYRPAGLLAGASTAANTFPYKVLVDETGPDGARVGISNGGLVTGNFGTDGWTRGELGTQPPYNRWTGYGVLHQGQTAVNMVALDRSVVETTGPVTLQVALIAKYNDPRAGSSTADKRANRLPSGTPDATHFQAYRMPHGALDVSHLTFAGEIGSGEFIANEISAATLTFQVTDWDARATPSSFGDLSLDPDVTSVGQGAEGIPLLSLCLPGVLTDDSANAGPASWIDFDALSDLIDDDTPVGGDPEPDSGVPGDALYFVKTVTKAAGAGQTSGTYRGLLRATDPEELLPGGHLSVALDGSTLAPLTSQLPRSITYQSFTVDMSEVLPPTGCSPAEIPFGGTPVGASLTPSFYQSIPPPGTGTSSDANMDSAAFPDTRFSPTGGIVMQNVNSTPIPYDYWLNTIPNSAPLNSAGWIQLTNFGATGFNKRSLQIECDVTGRVIMSVLGSSYPGGWGGGSFPYGAPGQKYLAGPTGAAPDLYWFDTVTSGPLPTTMNLISTGTIVPVALTLDRLGNIYGVDQQNVLHMWEKSTGYTLDPVDSGFPKDLSTIPEIGPPSVNKIHDFVYNERNAEFLMLWQPDSNNAFIARLECDLTTITVSAPGDFGAINWSRPADIGIDQVDSTGALLADQGEAQVITCSGQYDGIRIWNADTLTSYQTSPWPTFGSIYYRYAAVAIALNGTPGGPSVNWTGCILGHGVPAGGPNVGWQ